MAKAVKQPLRRRASSVRCGSVLLKPLLIQLLRGATQLPLERGPELARDLPVPLGVDGHKRPSAALERERPDNGPAAHCPPGRPTSHCAWAFRDQVRRLRRLVPEVLIVHEPVKVKMHIVAEPDLAQEIPVVLANPQESAAVKLVCLFVGLGQRLVDGHLVWEQLAVSPDQPLSCSLAAAQFLD